MSCRVDESKYSGYVTYDDMNQPCPRLLLNGSYCVKSECTGGYKNLVGCSNVAGLIEAQIPCTLGTVAHRPRDSKCTLPDQYLRYMLLVNDSPSQQTCPPQMEAGQSCVQPVCPTNGTNMLDKITCLSGVVKPNGKAPCPEPSKCPVDPKYSEYKFYGRNSNRDVSTQTRDALAKLGRCPSGPSALDIDEMCLDIECDQTSGTRKAVRCLLTGALSDAPVACDPAGGITDQIPGGGPGYKVSLGSSSGESGADGVYTKTDYIGSAGIDYYYPHKKWGTYRLSVPKVPGTGVPMQLERMTAQTMSYYWKPIFKLVPVASGSFKVQSIQGDVDIQGADVTYLSPVTAAKPVTDANPVTVDEPATAAESAAEAEQVPETPSACEALAKKENGPKVPVSCGASGDPSVVRVTRGAAVYARVPLYKQESGAWGGYGTDGAGSGVYVLVAATGHDVACVWDGAVTTTVAYKAIPSASESSTYALVPTNAGQSHATLVLVSGPTPFPIRTGAPRAESKLSPGAIAVIVASLVFVLFLVATAFLVRRKRR